MILVNLGGLDGEQLAEHLSFWALDKGVGKINLVLLILALVFECVVFVNTFIFKKIPVILQFRSSVLSISSESFSEVFASYDY